MLICTENKDILLESNKIFDYSKARTNTLVQTRDKGVCILLGNSKQKIKIGSFCEFEPVKEVVNMTRQDETFTGTPSAGARARLLQQVGRRQFAAQRVLKTKK